MKVLHKKQDVITEMQRREGSLWAGASRQEGFVQVPGEGWTGRKPSERYKEGHGGLTGPSGDRSAEGVNGVPGSSPPPPLPTVGTRNSAPLSPVQSPQGDKAGKRAGNKDRVSQIPIPRALTKAVRGWRGGCGDF